MARGYGVIPLLQHRIQLEEALISNEADLAYNTKIFTAHGDYAHELVVEKLTNYLISLREEYEQFELIYSKEEYPELWI